MVQAWGGTKPCEFIGFGAMEVTKPCEFIGFGAMEVTKPYEFIGFGAMEVGEVAGGAEPNHASGQAGRSRLSSWCAPLVSLAPFRAEGDPLKLGT